MYTEVLFLFLDLIKQDIMSHVKGRHHKITHPLVMYTSCLALAISEI